MRYTNVAIYHDLIYGFTEYFNNMHYEGLLSFKQIPNNIKPFFYKIGGEDSFMENLFRELFLEMVQLGSVSPIHARMMDYDFVVTQIKALYFKEGEGCYEKNNTQALQNISKLIENSEYSSDIKSALYSFFIDPNRVIQDVVRSILEIEMQVKHIHQSRCCEVNTVLNNINYKTMSEELNEPLSYAEKVNYDVCVIDSDCLEKIHINGDIIVLIGVNYANNCKGKRQEKLKQLSVVFAEINRFKILDLMKNNGEITVHTIEKKIGLTGTAAYYHLSILTESKAVATRTSGRTVLYSLNKSYFKQMSSMLLYFYE